MTHAGHSLCRFTSAAACKRARQKEIGTCIAMVKRKGGEPAQCTHWGIDRVNDRPYCGQHLNTIIIEADRKLREQAKREIVTRDINAFLEWTARHPSVHDRMPAGSCAHDDDKN